MTRFLATAVAFTFLAGAAPAFACPGSDAKQTKNSEKTDKATASKDKKAPPTKES